MTTVRFSAYYIATFFIDNSRQLYEPHARYQDLPPHTHEQVEVSYINRYVYVDLYRGTDARRPFIGRRVPLGGVMKVDDEGSMRVFIDRKGREIHPVKG